MKHYSRKEISFERVLFFCDAVVAIAITLLALDLKINIPNSQHLSFTDLIAPWQKYLAFILSFINIAGLWRTHHDFFVYIHKMDDRMMYLNIFWLFFIVTLPFATNVLSSHFGDEPAVLLYSLNVFFLSIFQNSIWDYADNKPDFVNKDQLSEQELIDIRRVLNLDMLNGLIAIIVSFFMPRLAFFLLFFKLPILLVSAFLLPMRRRQARNKKE